MTAYSHCRLLLVDDSRPVLNALNELFCDDYAVVLASSGAEAIEQLDKYPDIGVAILDIKMAPMDGIETGRAIRKKREDVRIIFHTGHPGDFAEDELEVNERPYDFIVKGRSSTRLIRSVRNAAESHRDRGDSSDLVEEAELKYGLIGRSAPMVDVYRKIKAVSRSDSKVMILGETGTGKELVAQAIYKTGKRKDRPLAVVNCNHKNTELVEAELFGYKKGAFTGADADRKGKFELANGGTIFLDEIGDLSGTTQIMLLRVLESGECQQMGPEGREFTTDVRVLCATHRNLKELVDNGTFRADLYHRLKGTVIELPPLRDRREDIPLLVAKFRDRLAAEDQLPYKVFSNDAIAALVERSWRGNVRRLLETVESLIVLTDSELIMAEDVTDLVESQDHSKGSGRKSLADELRDFERTQIIRALTETEGNISEAGKLLGVERSQLSRKIKSLGMSLVSFKNR